MDKESEQSLTNEKLRATRLGLTEHPSECHPHCSDQNRKHCLQFPYSVVLKEQEDETVTKYESMTQGEGSISSSSRPLMLQVSKN